MLIINIREISLILAENAEEKGESTIFSGKIYMQGLM